MEGLIPYVIHAFKRQSLHKQSYRCLSNGGSRHGYDKLLASAGNSFNARSSQPASVDDEEFRRSSHVKSNNNNNNNNNNGSFFVSGVQSYVGFNKGKKSHLQ
ncbi:hypothetical protein vseg_000768 [Gypsophila vaccaria]